MEANTVPHVQTINGKFQDFETVEMNMISSPFTCCVDNAPNDVQLELQTCSLIQYWQSKLTFLDSAVTSGTTISENAHMKTCRSTVFSTAISLANIFYTSNLVGHTTASSALNTPNHCNSAVMPGSL